LTQGRLALMVLVVVMVVVDKIVMGDFDDEEKRENEGCRGFPFFCIFFF
jgi:hypothetical protein